MAQQYDFTEGNMPNRLSFLSLWQLEKKETVCALNTDCSFCGKWAGQPFHLHTLKRPKKPYGCASEF
jgi:hypothetical protein